MFLNRSISAIDRTVTSINTPGQSGSESKGNYTPKISRTGSSPSDLL